MVNKYTNYMYKSMFRFSSRLCEGRPECSAARRFPAKFYRQIEQSPRLRIFFGKYSSAGKRLVIHKRAWHGSSAQKRPNYYMAMNLTTLDVISMRKYVPLLDAPRSGLRSASNYCEKYSDKNGGIKFVFSPLAAKLSGRPSSIDTRYVHIIYMQTFLSDLRTLEVFPDPPRFPFCSFSEMAQVASTLATLGMSKGIWNELSAEMRVSDAACMLHVVGKFNQFTSEWVFIAETARNVMFVLLFNLRTLFPPQPH